IPPRREDARAIRAGGKRLDAQVYAGLLSRGRAWLDGGRSAHEKQTYQPPASWLIVTVLGVPSSGRLQRATPACDSSGRLQRTRLAPLFERTRKPFSNIAPLPSSL